MKTHYFEILLTRSHFSSPKIMNYLEFLLCLIQTFISVNLAILFLVCLWLIGAISSDFCTFAFLCLLFSNVCLIVCIILSYCWVKYSRIEVHINIKPDGDQTNNHQIVVITITPITRIRRAIRHQLDQWM